MVIVETPRGPVIIYESEEERDAEHALDNLARGDTVGLPDAATLLKEAEKHGKS